MPSSNETKIPLETGAELRCPSYPEPCAYVRIVDPIVGEVAYWDSQEWAEDPEGVMGAILGAMNSRNED